MNIQILVLCIHQKKKKGEYRKKGDNNGNQLKLPQWTLNVIWIIMQAHRGNRAYDVCSVFSVHNNRSTDQNPGFPMRYKMMECRMDLEISLAIRQKKNRKKWNKMMNHFGQSSVRDSEIEKFVKWKCLRLFVVYFMCRTQIICCQIFQTNPLLYTYNSKLFKRFYISFSNPFCHLRWLIAMFDRL